MKANKHTLEQTQMLRRSAMSACAGDEDAEFALTVIRRGEVATRAKRRIEEQPYK